MKDDLYEVSSCRSGFYLFIFPGKEDFSEDILLSGHQKFEESSVFRCVQWCGECALTKYILTKYDLTKIIFLPRFNRFGQCMAESQRERSYPTPFQSY